MQNPVDCKRPYPGREATDLCNISLQELHKSREHHKSPRGETWILYFAVFGTDDECAVQRRIENDTIGIYPNFRMERLKEWSVQRVGEYVWTVRAVYGYGDYPNSFNTTAYRPTRMQMSTQGGTQKVTKAIDTLLTSDNAPNVYDAVEWDGKAVKGADVTSSRTRWRETWKMSFLSIFEGTGSIGMPAPPQAVNDYYEEVYSLVSMPLWQRWDLMTGWVHGVDSPIDQVEVDVGGFRQFLQGSIMFNGATMTQLDDYFFEVTFEFEHEANEWVDIPTTVEYEVDLTWPPDEARSARAGDTRVNPKADYYDGTGDWIQVYKRGHDYIQFYYDERDEDPGDDQGAVTIPVPVHFIYQQVKHYAPFQYLGVTSRMPLLNRLEGLKWDCENMIGYPMQVNGNEPIEPRYERSGFRWEAVNGNNCG